MMSASVIYNINKETLTGITIRTCLKIKIIIDNFMTSLYQTRLNSKGSS